MWSQKEDQLLWNITKTCKKLSWKAIAKKLSDINPKVKRSGKQCRERYRNYLNADITKEGWTEDERLLFVLLHSTFDNRWGEISKFYPNRNDLAMKNFFYMYLRKVLKKICNSSSSFYMGYSAWKLLEYNYIIDLVSSKYLPRLQKENWASISTTQDITLLTIISTRKLNAVTLKKYQKELFISLKNKYELNGCPITLWINPEKFEWSAVEVKALKKIIKKQNFKQFSRFLTIQIREPVRNQSSNDSNLCCNYSDCLPQPPAPAVLLPPFATLPCSIPPFFSIADQQPDAQIRFDAKDLYDGVREQHWSLSNSLGNCYVNPIISSPQFFSMPSPINVEPISYPVYPLYPFNTPQVIGQTYGWEDYKKWDEGLGRKKKSNDRSKESRIDEREGRDKAIGIFEDIGKEE